MKSLASFLLLFYSLTSFCQTDTTWYFGVNGKIGTENTNHCKKLIDFQSNKKTGVQTFFYNQNQWILSNTESIKSVNANTDRIKLKKDGFQVILTRTFTLNEDGSYQFSESINNKKTREGNTLSKIPLILCGKVIKFYPDGTKMSESIFENNELISNKNWLNDGTPYIDNIFYSTDSYPSYTLGNKILNKQLLSILNQHDIDYTKLFGKLIIGFVVFEDGHIGGLRIIKGINQQLDQIVIEAFNTIKGSWTPASLNGKKVKYFQQFPINFMHDADEVDCIDYATEMAIYYRY